MRTPAWVWVLLWSASMIAAFWVGARASSPRSAPPAMAPATPPTAITSAAVVSATQIRAIVREELARVPAAVPAAGADDSPDALGDEPPAADTAARVAQATA